MFYRKMNPPPKDTTAYLSTYFLQVWEGLSPYPLPFPIDTFQETELDSSGQQGWELSLRYLGE